MLFVFIYINFSWGGAAQFAEMAARKGKTVISICKTNNDGQQ